MRKHLFKRTAALLLIFALLLPTALWAQSSKEVNALPTPVGQQSSDTEDVKLATGESIQGPLFYSGTNVSIDGNVDGSAFVVGQNITVTGKVNGDLFVAGQKIDISGEVTGNIFVAGQMIGASNLKAQDAFIVGQIVTLNSTTTLRDAFLSGAELKSDATARQLYAGAENLVLGGTIDKDVYAGISSLTLKNEAVIKGNLNYESDKTATIANGAVIEGDNNWKKNVDVSNADYSKDEAKTPVDIFLSILYTLVAGFIIWLILELIFPSLWQKSPRPFSTTPVKTLGFGLLAILLLLPLLALLGITFVGLPAALFILLLSILLVMLAKITTANILAKLITEKFDLPHIHRGIWLFLASYLVLVILGKIPYVGPFISFLCVLITFGTVILAVFSRKQDDDQMVETKTIVESDYVN